jgi:hypothetical protein
MNSRIATLISPPCDQNNERSGGLQKSIFRTCVVAGDLVTAGSLFAIMTLCVGRLRSEVVCRYMDNHPKTLLVGLIVVAIVAILSAMP